MIQVAILAAIVLIAILLAPWLLGLMAFAVSAYGVWLVVLGAALAVAAIAGAVWGLISAMRRNNESSESPPIAGDRSVCPHCQAEVSARLSRCDSCKQLM